MTGKRTALPLPAPAIRPVADEWEWQESARCRSMDSSVFFHPDNERGRARRQREQRAKEICQQCPVKAPCAAFALLSGEPYGIWGGVSESERLSALGISDPRAAGNLSTAIRREARRAGLAAASCELCDDGRVIIFEQCRHWPQREQPTDTNREILRFLLKPPTGTQNCGGT